MLTTFDLVVYKFILKHLVVVTSTTKIYGAQLSTYHHFMVPHKSQQVLGQDPLLVILTVMVCGLRHLI